MTTDTSPLAGLRRKLGEARERRTLDLVVPSLRDHEGGVFVRYAPRVTFARAQQLREQRRRKAKGTTGWEIDAELDFLIESCVGVYAVVDGKPYGFSDAAPTNPDDWPRLSDETVEDIAAVLPGDHERALDVARALFGAGYAEEDQGLVDADVMAHSKRLADFYGFGVDLEDAEGESEPTRR